MHIFGKKNVTNFGVWSFTFVCIDFFLTYGKGTSVFMVTVVGGPTLYNDYCESDSLIVLMSRSILLLL